MFHREINVLDWRLRELADVVDDFVVVEATRTHSGLPREVLRPCGYPRFKSLAGRLHGAVLDNAASDDDPWLRERGQREAIWPLGVAPLQPGDDDLVIISDVDEVPFPEVVDRLATSTFEPPLYVRPHWFNFDWDRYLGPWDHASIVFYTAGQLRRIYSEGHGADVGIAGVPGRELDGLNGWHASWFGSDRQVLDKLASYAHANDARDAALRVRGAEAVRERRLAGGDLFGTRAKRRKRPRLPRFAQLALPDG